MKLYRINYMPEFPSFTKQLWALTSNTDACDNKYKNKWGQQEISPSPNLHMTSCPTPARWPEQLRQSHCRNLAETYIPQINQHCLVLTSSLDWQNCFVLQLQTTTSYWIWSIRCYIASNLLENTFYSVISTKKLIIFLSTISKITIPNHSFRTKKQRSCLEKLLNSSASTSLTYPRYLQY